MATQSRASTIETTPSETPTRTTELLENDFMSPLFLATVEAVEEAAPGTLALVRHSLEHDALNREARLAGVPQPVLTRARAVLEELEREELGVLDLAQRFAV